MKSRIKSPHCQNQQSGQINKGGKTTHIVGKTTLEGGKTTHMWGQDNKLWGQDNTVWETLCHFLKPILILIKTNKNY